MHKKINVKHLYFIQVKFIIVVLIAKVMILFLKSLEIIILKQLELDTIINLFYVDHQPSLLPSTFNLGKEI